MRYVNIALLLLAVSLHARPRVVSPMDLLRLRPATDASIGAAGCTLTTGVWPVGSVNTSDSYFLFGCPKNVTWGLLARNTDKGLQIGPCSCRTRTA